MGQETVFVVVIGGGFFVVFFARWLRYARWHRLCPREESDGYLGSGIGLGLMLAPLLMWVASKIN